MRIETFTRRVNIITGHYGSGKTNLAVNMALDLAALGRKTCLVDLDIVNPYFRAADMTPILERAGVKVIMPLYARTNLDIPALPGEINTVFDDREHTVILDVGGDDAGAAALGRFAGVIAGENNFRHFYVFNARRALTQCPDQAVELMREIEKAGRLPVTDLVNNTNLAGETQAGLIEASDDFAKQVSLISGIPVAFTCVKNALLSDLSVRMAQSGRQADIYPVEIYVNPPW